MNDIQIPPKAPKEDALEYYIRILKQDAKDEKEAELLEHFIRDAVNGNKKLADIMMRMIKAAKKPMIGCEVCDAQKNLSSWTV
jgi:hypothetical protein